MHLNSLMYFIDFYPFVSTAEDHVVSKIASEDENGSELKIENNVDAPIEIVDSSDDNDGEDFETQSTIDKMKHRMELINSAQNTNDQKTINVVREIENLIEPEIENHAIADSGYENGCGGKDSEVQATFDIMKNVRSIIENDPSVLESLGDQNQASSSSQNHN